MWAVVYVVVYVGSLSMWAAVQLGWHPGFVAVWDSRSTLIVGGMALVSSMIALARLLALAPRDVLPGYLRNVPPYTAFFGTMFAFEGMLGLSSALTLYQSIWVVGRWLAGGAAIGLIVGIITSVVREKGDPSNRPVGNLQALGILVLVVVGGFTYLSLPRVRDDQKIEDFGTFQDERGRLEIGINGGSIENHEFGVVKIVDGAQVNSLVLEADEWKTFMDVWKTAKRVRSAPFRVIGYAHDTVPPDPSTLAIFSGPHIRFLLMSAHGPSVSFDIAEKDIPALDKAIARVGQSILS